MQTQHSHLLLFIYTILIISTLIFINTEILSFFNLVSVSAIRISWGIFTIVSGFLFFRQNNYKLFNISISIKSFLREYTYLKVGIIFILVVTFCICVAAYPNTWDSMTYHLGRIMHWLQNGNTKPFPTAIDRQVFFQPFAEYFMMHLYALTGTDKGANFVQWICMIGCFSSVLLLTKEISGNRKAQWMSVFFVATIPMGILQSTSTQTDFITAFFILCAVLFLFKNIKNNFIFSQTLPFAISLALACITKGTAYIFLLPVVVLFGIACLRAKKIAAYKNISLVIIVFLIFNSLHLLQNYEVSGNTVGNDYALKNEVISLPGLWSNMSKNLAMHLRTPVKEVNIWENNAIINLHKIIGLDVDAKKFNWKTSPSFLSGNFSLQEDSAGSLPDILLFIIAILFICVNKKYRNSSTILLLLILISMYILFCLTLKWQIWHVRLHLPMLVLMAPLLASVVSKWNVKMQAIICLLFILYSLPFLFYNQSRPIVSKKNIFYTDKYNQYFMSNMRIQKPFFDISAIIQRNNLKNIAWATTGDAWEYPMWVLLKDDAVFMQHILVQNPTASLESKKPFQIFLPDGIITNCIEPDSLGQMHYKDKDYYLTYKNEPWKFYILMQNSM